jgi:hypothetical protein
MVRTKVERKIKPMAALIIDTAFMIWFKEKWRKTLRVPVFP